MGIGVHANARHGQQSRQSLRKSRQDGGSRGHVPTGTGGQREEMGTGPHIDPGHGQEEPGRPLSGKARWQKPRPCTDGRRPENPSKTANLPTSYLIISIFFSITQDLYNKAIVHACFHRIRICLKFSS